MFSRIRRRITWANVAMTLALVFAMSGGAYAAKKYLITSTKQISPKVLKALQGKPGAAGPQGPAGAKGETGPTGANGKDGANGVNGTSASAKSFTGTKKLGSEECTEGGLEITSASGASLVCNGVKGQTGFTRTLPSGQTETGAWAVAAPAREGPTVEPLASFTIPLARSLSGGEGCLSKSGALIGTCQVHFINKNGKEVTLNEGFEKEELIPTGCAGSAAKPEAEEGNLCVYESTSEGVTLNDLSIFNPETNEFGSAGATGALGLAIYPTGSHADGTWAVTAP